MIKWFLISFTLFIFLLLFSSIRLILSGSLGPNESRIVLEVRALYGLIHTELRLRRFESVIDEVRHLIKWQEIMHGSLPAIGELRPRISIGPISARIRFAIGLLRKKRQNRWLSDGLKRGIVIQELRWQTVLGTDDAMDTAIAVGVLWGAKASILGYLSGQIPVMKCGINVEPDYRQAVFNTRLRCTVNFRAVHLMLGLIIIGSTIRGIRIQKS